MWIDVTWGAGGSTADKTLEICINALKYHGLNVMMHLLVPTCQKVHSRMHSTPVRNMGSATFW